MAADELRGAVDRDVHAVLERPKQDRRQHGVVADHAAGPCWWATSAIARKSSTSFFGIGQRFDVDGPGVGADRPGDVARVRGVDEGHVDAQPLEGLPQQRDRAAVERGGRDDVLAGVGQIEQGHGDGLLSAGEGQGPDAAFQGRHPLLEHVGRGIHQPRVDPTQFLQGEQVGRVLRALEHVAGGLVDGHGPRAGGRVGLLPGVHRQRPQSQRPGIVRGHGFHPLSPLSSGEGRGVRARRVGESPSP